MKHPPAFLFYPADFISGTMALSVEQKGAYISLLCYQWMNDSIPDDPMSVARITGIPPVTTADGSAIAQPCLSHSSAIAQLLAAKFTKCADGSLQNEKLERVRSERASFYENRSKFGQKGAEVRWKHGSAIAKPSLSHSSANGKPIASHFSSLNSQVQEKDSTPKPPKGGSECDSARALKAKREADAEAIYQLYPLKVGKPAAIRAILKALTQDTPERLKRLTEAFAIARGGDTAFTPHPATWFNQARYNDDPETWVKQAPLAPQKPREKTLAEKECDRLHARADRDLQAILGDLPLSSIDNL